MTTWANKSQATLVLAMRFDRSQMPGVADDNRSTIYENAKGIVLVR